MATDEQFILGFPQETCGEEVISASFNSDCRYLLTVVGYRTKVYWAHVRVFHRHIWQTEGERHIPDGTSRRPRKQEVQFLVLHLRYWKLPITFTDFTFGFFAAAWNWIHTPGKSLQSEWLPSFLGEELWLRRRLRTSNRWIPDDAFQSLCPTWWRNAHVKTSSFIMTYTTPGWVIHRWTDGLYELPAGWRPSCETW